MKKILLILFCVACFEPVTAIAASGYYIAANIPVLLEGPTASDTRDQALLKAQKLALSQFIPLESTAKLSSISDTALARTMKDFSLQNERVLSQSYQAQFTIRFDPTRFEGLLRSYNLPMPPAKELDLANFKPAVPVPPKTANPTATDDLTVATDDATPPQQTVANNMHNVVVLPVLNTSNKLILWDEVNAWRDAWQNPGSSHTAHFIVPLGDVADVTDAPDTGFLKQKDQPQPGLDNILKRYNAPTLYLVLAQNVTTGKGLGVKLYRYHDAVLEYKGNIATTARPGYLFNDAVTTVAAQIDRLEKGQTLAGSVPDPLVDTTASAVVPNSPVATAVPTQTGSGNLVAIVPFQTISAWIVLQQQIRQTPGVVNIITQSISSNQAVVRIDSALPTAQMLQNLQGNGFVLQQQPGDTRYTLYQRNG